MRDPMNKQYTEIYLDEKTYMTFDSLPEYNKTDYDLNIEKEFKKYVLDIKRDTRTSFEYSHFISFLKENLNMNQCSFFKNVSSANSRRIKIEVHHDPFTIEDIIRIVIQKRKDNGESMDVHMVSKEVTYLHYMLLVGLIPLSSTVHELVGNGYLFIPTTKVMGNYKEFVNLYYDYISPEQKDILQRIEEATAVYDEYEGSKLLTKHLIYIDLSGDEYQFPSYQDITDMMRDRLAELTKPVEVQQEKYLVTPMWRTDKENELKIF